MNPEEKKEAEERAADYLEALERERLYLLQTGQADRVPLVDAEIRARGGKATKTTRLRGEKA